jgi:hypothetical protein
MAKASSAPQDVTACPEWGKGGSYQLDPKTGQRTLVERGGQADVQPAADAAAANPEPTPAVKGTDHA